MSRIETKVFRDPWDVNQRLDDLKLTRQGLLKVRAVALQEAANATPHHCKNAPGTFAYQHGTWALREVFVGDDWSADVFDGVEVIRNEKLKIRIAYSNVDIACNDDQPPKPRSKKGAGAERVCIGNLFGDLPIYTHTPTRGEATYYVMVDENGAVELTRPVVKNGTFLSYIERIYLSDGSDLAHDPLALDDNDIADGFDPQVARK